jgi:uncharacterized protein YjbJ (UPF0337 family)
LPLVRPGIQLAGRHNDVPPAPLREVSMAFDDKVDNKAEELGGKVKEGVGKATDDERLEAEGKTDQTSSNLKQAGEKIKDAFKR